jgi:hypothetical protein
LIKNINLTRQKTLKDHQRHDFSITVENGAIGFSFVSLPANPEKLEPFLMSLVIAKKYRTKAKIWLGFGWVSESPSFVDGVVFNDSPWVEDEELEEFSKKILISGKVLNSQGEKIGRNDPCPCQSGKKYKICCRK